MYLFNAQAPQRISQLMPDVKIIALLRNPTDRAISHFRHSCDRGREHLPILEALEAEEDRIGEDLRNNDFSNENLRHFSYKSRGLYADQIRRYLEYFPRENLLFLRSETFFRLPAPVLRRVLEFTGVDPDFEIPDLSPHNVSERSADIPTEVYDYLNDWFRDPNRDLYDLLEQDMGW